MEPQHNSKPSPLSTNPTHTMNPRRSTMYLRLQILAPLSANCTEHHPHRHVWALVSLEHHVDYVPMPLTQVYKP